MFRPSIIVDRLKMRWRLAAWLFCTALGFYIALAFRDFGLTWDEDSHMLYGQGVLHEALWLFRAHDLTGPAYTHLNLYLYGGLFDGIEAAIIPLIPGDPYEAKHLLTALVGLAGIIACGRIALMLSRVIPPEQGEGSTVTTQTNQHSNDAAWRSAFWAILLLALTPGYIGLLFNNPKDIPFAAASAWGLVAILRLLAPTRRRIQTHIADASLLTLTIGAAMGVRIGGAILIGYLILALIIDLIAAHRDARLAPTLPRSSPHPFTRAAFLTLIVAIGAWLIMLLGWPWARLSLTNNALSLFQFLLARQSVWTTTELYEGSYVTALTLPRTYLPHMLAITLPEIVLALMAVGACLTVRSAWRWRRTSPLADGSTLRARGAWVLIMLAAFFPWLYIIGTRAPVYDGLRHITFTLPPLMAMLGVLAARLTTPRTAPRSASQSPAPRRAIATILACGCLWQIVQLARLHPYEYVQYNSLAGGTARAAKLYETDFWGLSYREAVNQLIARVQRENPAGARAPHRIKVSSNPFLSQYYFPPGFILETDASKSDYFISTTRWGLDETVTAPTIIKVQRAGATLAVVKDCKAPTPRD